MRWTKTRHYLFGNLVVFRSEAALEQQSPFATPSLPIEVPAGNGFDLDSPDDLKLGDALVAAGLVHLPRAEE